MLGRVILWLVLFGVLLAQPAFEHVSLTGRAIAALIVAAVVAVASFGWHLVTRGKSPGVSSGYWNGR